MKSYLGFILSFVSHCPGLCYLNTPRSKTGKLSEMMIIQILDIRRRNGSLESTGHTKLAAANNDVELIFKEFLK